MTILLFANNAESALADPISSASTTCQLTPGTGSLFPSPSAGQGFKLTLNDLATGLLTEIVLCTSRTNDTLTIVRAQEGTTAQAWLANDPVGMFYTAGSEENNIQLDQYQQGTYTNAVAFGVANAITATIPSNLNYVPDGFGFTITSAYANTGGVTLNLTMGTTITGAKPIVKAGNVPLLAGDIPSDGYPITLSYSATYGAYVMNNPALGNANSLSPSQLQQQFFTYAVATGSADSIAVSLPFTLLARLPSAPAALTDGLEFQFRANFANGTATPNLTLTLGSLNTGTYTIVKGNNLPLQPGDIPGQGFVAIVAWSTLLTKWVLLNPFFNPSSLGSMASQNANAVAITGGSISGITPLPGASGGTGVSNLPQNQVLIGNSGSVTGVPPSNIGNVLQSNGSTWNSSPLGGGWGGTRWRNVTGARAFNATYSNPYPYPIYVSATSGAAVTSAIRGYVDGVLVSFFQWQFNGNGSFGGCFLIVPVGSTYQLQSSQSVYNWAELY